MERKGQICSNTDCNEIVRKIVMSNRASFSVQMSKIPKLTLIIVRYTSSFKMPNTKSAIRRIRRVKKQTFVNRLRKTSRSAVKHMESLVKSGNKEKILRNIFQNFNQFHKRLNLE